MPTSRRRVTGNPPVVEPSEPRTDADAPAVQPDAEPSPAVSEPPTFNDAQLLQLAELATDVAAELVRHEHPNVHQCIAKAMALVKPVGKEGENRQDGYKFKRIDDFMTAANRAMAEAGVHCVPKVLKRIANDTDHTTSRNNVLRWVDLKMRFRFYGPAGDYVDAILWGEGRDASDKATNKALTAAQKYALMYVLMVPTSDIQDADRDSPEQDRGPSPDEQRKIDEQNALIARDDADAETVASFRHDVLVICDRDPVGVKRRDALQLSWRMAGTAGALGCEITLPAAWQAIAGVPTCTLHQLYVGAQNIAVPSGEGYKTEQPAAPAESEQSE